MHYTLPERGKKFLDVGENAPRYKLTPNDYAEPLEKLKTAIREATEEAMKGRDDVTGTAEKTAKKFTNFKKLTYFEEWLRETALTKAIQLHTLTFPNENTESVRRKIREFCSESHQLDEAQSLKLWRHGDALSLRAIQLGEVANEEQAEDTQKTTEEQDIEFKNLNSLLEYALREFVKNIFRRVNVYEVPLAEGLIAAFRDVSRPAMFPIEMTSMYDEFQELPTPDEFKGVARMLPMFWKSELQAQISLMIEKSGADPAQQALLNAALYQSLKTFFGDDEQFASDKVELDLDQREAIFERERKKKEK